MMNNKDIKEFHDLDKLKDPYKPLPYGLVIADSGISGQGLFTTRKLVRGTHLGESHYRLDGELIRTPLGGFINHSDEPNCLRSQVRIKPHYDKWTITVIEDIEEGDMYVFPAWLKHWVYPFKTDCTRISVSGNVIDKIGLDKLKKSNGKE